MSVRSFHKSLCVYTTECTEGQRVDFLLRRDGEKVIPVLITFMAPAHHKCFRPTLCVHPCGPESAGASPEQGGAESPVSRRTPPQRSAVIVEFQVFREDAVRRLHAYPGNSHGHIFSFSIIGGWHVYIGRIKIMTLFSPAEILERTDRSTPAFATGRDEKRDTGRKLYRRVPRMLWGEASLDSRRLDSFRSRIRKENRRVRITFPAP